MCMDNPESQFSNGVLGRLVNEAGEPKEPSHCIIQYGGRVRLPDKLMEILNKEFAPEVMWWQPDGECLAFDSETVQKKILDVWFRGTKLSSFIRSLNRWGFRRVFYHALPTGALAFHHSSFRKNSTPEMLKTMKMSKSGKASAAKAEKPASTPILPTSYFHPVVGSPVTSTAARLSPLSQLAAATAPISLSVLPQLPMPSATSSVMTSFEANSANHHETLLKILSEQRSRELLALAAAGNMRASITPSPASVGSSQVPSAVPSLEMAFAAAQQEQQQQRTREEEQQRSLLFARAEQAILARQGLTQQQERKEAALRLAILKLKSGQKPSLF